ncbi:unnamed protein product [Symbiodinium sp. CCMP2592]|nr:unnamed protein product [Symbiodinium sp. CCMP2592]
MAESCSPRWGQAEPSRALQVLHVWLACLITLPVAGDKAVAAAASVDSRAEAWGRMIAVGAADGFAPAAELQAKNAECLMTGQGQGGAAVLYNASGHFVTMLQDAFQPQVAGRAVSLGSRQVASLAGSLQALIELEGHIASACFSRELLLDLRKASDALLLLRAQNGRLMLQRTDVHDDLVTASKDFAHEEYASFGRDLGGLWRRAFRDAVSSTKQKKEEAVPAMPGPKRPTSSDLLEVTSALLRSFFGHRSDGRAIFLWEHPVLFDHCIGKMSLTLPALEELWDSIGEVLLQVAPSEKLWSFSTPDEQVTTREVQQLAQLGRILQELPMILQDCGLQGNAQKMFLQSVTVFRSPPDKILNAAASSLFVLEQHWTASAWQAVHSWHSSDREWR